MNHNDLELQTGDLKLYGCLPVVMHYMYQAEYVLLHNIQKYGKKTIAYLRKGCAFLEKIMKGHNQRGNRNGVTFTFLHFVQLQLCMVHMYFEINSIIHEFSSTTGSSEEIINLL